MTMPAVDVARVPFVSEIFFYIHTHRCNVGSRGRCFNNTGQDSEWWQVKRITSILDSEYAQQKAVHSEHHCSPHEHCDLLFAWV